MQARQQAKWFRQHSARFITRSPKLPPSYEIVIPVYQQVLDRIAALLGCLLLPILIPCIWLANGWWALGPLFYHQPRVGRSGHIFQMVVFSLFFGQLAGIPSDSTPYPIFTYTALVPWSFFASGLNSSANSLEGMVKSYSNVIPAKFVGLLFVHAPFLQSNAMECALAFSAS